MTAAITATVVSTRTHIELAFTDGPVITDEFETPTQVTSLRITYVNGQPTAVALDSTKNLWFMQPADLDQVAKWPDWLRDLVEQHRPAIPGRDCPTCGAPADETGTRIPEHRPGSPCTVDYRAV